MSDGAAAESQGPSLVGQVLDGRYRLTKKLGEGGMGEVYAAEHVHIDKRFAIKLLKPEIVSNEEAVKRFYQEARSSSSIGHRNIIAIEDFGKLSDGRVYMCMELLNGAPLNDMLQTPMPVDRLLNILIQTGHGLAAAHAKGIVHRDMKPENIYVTVGPNGEDIPKLLDFGIAKVSGNDGQNHLTRTGTIFGTPFYMAPEQALGNPVDQRTDIYAMGVIMYEVFAGSLPFQGESFMGILTQHITTEPEPVAQRAAKAGREISPALAEIINRCVRKNPAERFQTMDELVAALVNVYRSLAGAGMSTYMEAFNHPSANTPGAMLRPTGGGSGAITPPPGNTGSQPLGQPMGATMMAGSPPMGQSGQQFQQTPNPYGGAPASQSQPVGALANSGSGLYNPSTAQVKEVKKGGGGMGLIIGLIVLVVLAGGGAAAYFLVLAKDKGPSAGPGSGSAGDKVAQLDPTKSGSAVEVKPSGDGSAKTVEPKGNEPKGSDATDPKASGGTTPTPTPDAAPADNHDTPPPVTPDAAPAGPEMKRVILTSTNVRAFEVWDGDKKLGDGPMDVEVPAGGKRIVTIKAKNFKDRQMVVYADKGPVQFPMDRIGGGTPPHGNGEQHTNAGSGEVKNTPPPGVNCKAAIVDPKNAACRKQYCDLHPSEFRCQAE